MTAILVYQHVSRGAGVIIPADAPGNKAELPVFTGLPSNEHLPYVGQPLRYETSRVLSE